MKIRTGFVSNSSSSSFIIHNISNRVVDKKDFAKEIKEATLNWVLDTYDDDPQWKIEKLEILSTMEDDDYLQVFGKTVLQLKDYEYFELDDCGLEGIITDMVGYEEFSTESFRIVFDESHH